MKMIATFLIVLAFASSSISAAPFDMDRIAGQWYQVLGATLNASIQNSMNISWDFTLREDQNFNLTILSTLPDGSKYSEYLLVERTSKPIYFLLHPIAKKDSEQVPLMIIFTDFDHYLIGLYYIDGYFSHQPPYAVFLSRTESMNTENTELTDLLAFLKVTHNPKRL